MVLTIRTNRKLDLWWSYKPGSILNREPYERSIGSSNRSPVGPCYVEFSIGPNRVRTNRKLDLCWSYKPGSMLNREPYERSIGSSNRSPIGPYHDEFLYGPNCRTNRKLDVWWSYKPGSILNCEPYERPVGSSNHSSIGPRHREFSMTIKNVWYYGKNGGRFPRIRVKTREYTCHTMGYTRETRLIP